MSLHAPQRGAENENLVGHAMDCSAAVDNDETGSGSDGQASAAHLVSLQGDILQLRAELECLRTDRAKLIDRQARLMELMGTTKVEQLVHDLRNVLNERNLLRVLAEGPR